MNEHQDIIKTLSLTLAASWASGINVYACLALLGFLGLSDTVNLPQGLDILENPLIIGISTFMYCVEFVADKTPGVDTAWDALHSFIRIPIGVMLALATVGNDASPGLMMAAAMTGFTISSMSHVLKSGSRAMINTSPEPFSNWTASVTEDLMVFGGIWTALSHPTIFLFLLLIFVLVAIYIIPKIFGALKMVFAKIQNFFGIKQHKTKVLISEKVDKSESKALSTEIDKRL